MSQDSAQARLEKFRPSGNTDRASLIFDNRREDQWLSTQEAARYLCISENALRIMVHRGQIEAFKLGRRLRFRVSDCQALFRKKGAIYGN